MAEEAEDVKPKIDLTINYEGQSQHFPFMCGRALWNWGTHAVRMAHLFSQRVRSR